MKKTARPSRPAPALAIWGVHPVLEFLRHQPQQIKEIFLARTGEQREVRQILALAERQGVPVRQGQGLNLPEGEGVSHQGVAASIHPLQPMALAELLERLTSKAAPLLLVLDSIQDPHNLGAIIRSAAAAGADGIILPKDRSAPLSGTTLKASAGTLAFAPLCQVTNLAQTLKELKKKGFWLYGAAGGGGQPLYETAFSGPLCLVIGGEGKGLRPLVAEQCDQLLAIPMAPGVESLNASVAAGVILFEMVRQRR
jgi:23S rRNA (guanosine2251-2'-O)-methyltransferase